jgi:hypothetical protein
MSDVEVQFLREGGVIGTDRTNARGKACIQANAGGKTWKYTARVQTDDYQGVSKGHVFVWGDEHPAVAIDIDETLMRSQYVGLIFNSRDPSRPMPHSRKVIKQLSEHYGIVYISARSRLFRNKTRYWLQQHGYPLGPVVLGDNFNSIAWQHHSKLDMMTRLSKKLPSLSAGIGDKSADEEAFLANELQCIIISSFYPWRDEKTIVVDDWRGVGKILLQDKKQIQQAGKIVYAAASQPANYKE